MSISNDILHEYLQVSRCLSAQLRVCYGKFNLTYPQSIALTILQADGPMPISALAEAAGSANSTISGVVDRLEKLGLVERKRSETDRRVIYVATTPRFQAQFNKVASSASDRFSQSLDDLSDRERQTVLEGLRLLHKTLADDGE